MVSTATVCSIRGGSHGEAGGGGGEEGAGGIYVDFYYSLEFGMSIDL